MVIAGVIVTRRVVYLLPNCGQEVKVIYQYSDIGIVAG